MSGLDILITTSYYWPEEAGSAPYLAGLAEHLQERGHRVVVATGYPHYPEWRLPDGARLSRTDWHGAVKVRRRWHYVPRSQTAAHRAALRGDALHARADGAPAAAPAGRRHRHLPDARRRSAGGDGLARLPRRRTGSCSRT